MPAFSLKFRNPRHIIDLSPEGGFRGGNIVATGTPEQVAYVAESCTVKFLKGELK